MTNISNKIPLGYGYQVINALDHIVQEKRSYIRNTKGNDALDERDVKFLSFAKSFLHPGYNDDSLEKWQNGTIAKKVFFTIVNSKEVEVRMVDTPSSLGIAISLGYIKQCMSFFLKLNQADNNWTKENAVLLVIDAINFLKESKTDIIEFAFVSKLHKPMLSRLSQSRYSWRYNSDWIELHESSCVFPISSRYEKEAFINLLLTTYGKNFDDNQKLRVSCGEMLRISQLPKNIIDSEYMVCR